MAVFWTASNREKEKYAINANSIPRLSIDLNFIKVFKNLNKYIYRNHGADLDYQIILVS